jgi:hypothetical protein
MISRINLSGLVFMLLLESGADIELPIVIKTIRVCA